MTQYQEKIVGKPGGLVEPGVKQYGIFKKIKKAVKKIVKSPIGKAALIGGGLYGLNRFGIGSSGIGKNWWSKGMGLGKNLLMGKSTQLGPQAGRAGGIWNWMKGNPGKAAVIGGGILGTTLPFLGGDEEDEENILPWDVTSDSIAKIRQMAKDRHPSLAFLPPTESVMSGYYGSKDGGIVGLANGGQPAEAQAEQMLKMEYQKYRNQGGTMSYQQFKMAVLQQAQGQGPMAQGQQAPQMAAYGGRIGYNRGRVVNPGGYAGESGGILETIKNFPKNLKSGFEQIFSGETQAYLGDDQEKINEFLAKDMWGIEGDMNQETIEMIIDMNKRGMKIDEIVSLTGSDNKTVTDIISILNMKAHGGRAGYQGGELVEDASMIEETPAGMMEENVEEVQGEPTREQMEALAMEIFQLRLEELDEEQLMVVYQAAMEQQPREEMMQEEIEFNPQMAQPQMAAEGGIMNLGGVEKDYRQEGGFVPLGKKEKADDVPARLSKNEFVFTADAVRNAGGGDIDAGAEVMQNMMNNLEEGGQISEESQGAQEMYDQQQMLQSRMA